MFLVRSSFPKLSKALYPNGSSLRSALLFEGAAVRMAPQAPPGRAAPCKAGRETERQSKESCCLRFAAQLRRLKV